MKWLFVVLLVFAGCEYFVSAPASCDEVLDEGFVDVECDDFLRVNDSSFVVMLADDVESASFSAEGFSCERIRYGDFTEVVCLGSSAQKSIEGNLSGTVFFENASRPYMVNIYFPKR